MTHSLLNPETFPEVDMIYWDQDNQQVLFFRDRHTDELRLHEAPVFDSRLNVGLDISVIFTILRVMTGFGFTQSEHNKAIWLFNPGEDDDPNLANFIFTRFSR